MNKGNFLTTLLRSKKTVFSTRDIALLWQEPSSSATRERLNYFVKKGALYRIRQGLYAKSENFNPLELATRILTPAYVSFETVLVKEGLIFQFYEPIFVASYTTRLVKISQLTFSFRKLKDEILLDDSGILHIDETSIATRERAFLDMVYLKPNFYFDNLVSLNWELVFNILPIYTNQRVDARVQALYHQTVQSL